MIRVWGTCTALALLVAVTVLTTVPRVHQRQSTEAKLTEQTRRLDEMQEWQGVPWPDPYRRLILKTQIPVVIRVVVPVPKPVPVFIPVGDP